MSLFLKKIAARETLSEAEAEQAMHTLMRGEASPETIAAFLMGLHVRGETLDELVGFTKTMRAYMVTVPVDDPHAIDVCGTGGDHSGTFNISTTVAFVCAGAGVTVAKHGNRSVSSQSGSADVLEALGAVTTLHREGVVFCLREVGLAFLFAPYFHPAMKHVMPTRKALGIRTFFNILGPLCNPAGVKRQLIGVFDKTVAEQMAGILFRLGAEQMAAVHGEEGLDEISIAGPTHMFSFGPDDVAPQSSQIAPEMLGLTRAPLTALRGGSAEENAEILRAILNGRETGPKRDAVLLNAAHALQISGRFTDLRASLAAARESLDSGAALHKLDAFIAVSHAAAKQENAAS